LSKVLRGVTIRVPEQRSSVMSEFANKTVFVTGGAYGLGRAVTRAFAQAGAKVTFVDIHEQHAEETLRLVRQDGGGGEAAFIRADVREEAAMKNAVAAAVQRFGPLHYAVNNAGITMVAAPVTELSATLYDTIMNTNVKGVWLGMKYEIPELLKSGGGAIVNITSGFDETAAGGVAFYVASKHAIMGLTRSAALEWVKHGIRINAVAPGGMNTGMVEEWARVNPELMETTRLAHPIGRIADPAEVAPAVLFLCSKGAGFMVGASVKVDGGYTVQ
jgi:NAD(P)-dependent dehydrogenase (short-subunit alcohol dehydrogenase family)